MDALQVVPDTKPRLFNLPLVDYGPGTEIYCKGFIRYPSDEEKERSSSIPVAIFQPVEPHGWKIWLYSLYEIKSFIEKHRDD